jgi:hypothetical protein
MYFNTIRNNLHGKNWEKEWTDSSMCAKRKWRSYCHLSDGRKWKWKTQWNRKRWVLLLEIFMYLYIGNTYILLWNETNSFYILLSIHITLEWKRIRWMKISAHFLWKHVLVHLLLASKFCTAVRVVAGILRTSNSPQLKVLLLSAKHCWNELHETPPGFEFTTKFYTSKFSICTRGYSISLFQLPQ